MSSLTDKEACELLHSWEFWARPSQLAPPGDWWTIWLILAGRGFGKTRIGAEWVRHQVETRRCRRIALVAETAADARDVMVEGESGILSISPPWFKPEYEPSKRRLTWPNGAIATTYSADKPDQLRGPQHDGAWADEVAKWRYADAWDQLMFGLRLGLNPQCVSTTTPRPIKLIRDLVKDSTVVITRGSTYENLANLAPAFAKKIIQRYEGTRLGRQELMAEILEDVPGALWQRAWIDRDRRTTHPQLSRIVVSIDPAVTSGEDSNDTAITVCGLGIDWHGYVLESISDRWQPEEWARKAVNLYHKHKADRVVGEVNNGGDMIEAVIRAVDPNVSYKSVRASRGKVVRAEPISALYEKGKVHHVGSFPKLEDQMCMFTSDFDREQAGYSPDDVDSLVWGLTELMITTDGMFAGGDLS